METTIREMPQGDFCYDLHIFTDSVICPDYKENKPMSPQCLKHNCKLDWTISGRVLKCKECEDASKS
jgi:hypothetical protein